MNNYKFSTQRPVINSTISESYQDFGMLLTDAKKHSRLKLIKKLSIISALIILSATLVFYSNEVMIADHPDVVIENGIPESQTFGNTPNDSAVQKDTILVSSKNKTKSQRVAQEGNITAAPSKQGMELPEKEEEKVMEDYFLQAEPANGYESLYEYFDQHFTPLISDQLDSSINKIVVSFSIATSGNVTNVLVEKSIHPTLDSMAIEVVKNMPKWNPGTLNGNPIQTNHKIPLHFQQSTK